MVVAAEHFKANQVSKIQGHLALNQYPCLYWKTRSNTAWVNVHKLLMMHLLQQLIKSDKVCVWNEVMHQFLNNDALRKQTDDILKLLS